MLNETEVKEIPRLHWDCSTRFANHALRVLMANGDGRENIVFSPARLQAVLVLLANWTTPEIRKQILDLAVSEAISLGEANTLFDFANIKPLPNNDFAHKGKNGNPIAMIPTMEQQTTLWYKENLKINKKAVENTKSAFNLCTKAVNFADPKTKRLIDDDVCKLTHSLLKHIDIGTYSSISAIIIDIIYFKAAWRNQFKDYNTAKHFFYGTKKRQCVQTMNYQGLLYYQENPLYQAVSLPYICNSINQKYFAMRIYLPTDKYTITDVLEEMSKNKFDFHSKLKEIKLSLPRFDVSDKMDIKKILREMGMSCILESSNIIPKCIEGLQISNISQHVRIKVDENGTEATSITVPSHKLGLFKRRKRIVMKVNKPFLFEIVEETKNMVLFSGMIYNIFANEK